MMNLNRGFALVISVILTSVVLAVGIALLDIAYKQVVLASAAKNSQYAFYNADSAMECALYYDQKINAFYYDESQNVALECNGLNLGSPTYSSLVAYSESQTASVRTTRFNIPCADASGINATITILKTPSGSTNIYSNGYSSCNASLNTRIERGLKVHY